MRTSFCIIILLLLNLPLSQFCMEGRTKRGLLERLSHWCDTKIDPSTHITQNESIEVHNKVMSLNPSLPKPVLFVPDDNWRGEEGYIAKAIRRQQALLCQIEFGIFGGIIYNADPSVIAQLMDAKPKIEGYFSPHALAVLAGYYEYRINMARDAATQYSNLSKATSGLNAETKNSNPLEEKKSIETNFTEPMPYEEYRNLVVNDNSRIIEKYNNKKRKDKNPIEHLTHSKTALFGNQLLRFDPKHPGHNSDKWHFNPRLPEHQRNVEKAFERERRLLDEINKAIQEGTSGNIIKVKKLNFVNPDEPNTVTISEGYFSPVLKAIISGYLAYRSTSIAADLKIQEEQERQRQLEEQKKKAAEDETVRKKAQEEAEEKARAAEIVAKKRQEEIESRAQAIAQKQIQEDRRMEAERKAYAEAEATFKATEEKQKAEAEDKKRREASLKALEGQDAPPNGSTGTLAATGGSPTNSTANAASPAQSTVPKLDQNPEDLCACSSGKKNKNCCKKPTPSGLLQQP